MKQLKLMESERVENGFGHVVFRQSDSHAFVTDFARMLDLAAERGYTVSTICCGETTKGDAVVWFEWNNGEVGIVHPNLHAAIKAEIARLEKP